jgi:hypothetical protein
MGWDGNHARQDNQMTDKTKLKLDETGICKKFSFNCNFKFFVPVIFKKKKKKKKKKEQQRSDGKTKMR